MTLKKIKFGVSSPAEIVKGEMQKSGVGRDLILLALADSTESKGKETNIKKIYCSRSLAISLMWILSGLFLIGLLSILKRRN